MYCLCCEVNCPSLYAVSIEQKQLPARTIASACSGWVRAEHSAETCFSPSPFLCLFRVSCPGSFLNQVRVHSFQDGFASLILHPRRQSQESDVCFGQHLTDFKFWRDRIPDEDRLEKAGGLFDKRHHGPFQHRG